MKKNVETLLYSAGGVIALAVILIAVNFMMSPVIVRADLTAGHVNTLSAGTRQILGKLKYPVTIRFYYTQSGEAMPVALRAFAGRVEDLLSEYESASHGKVVVEKFDPQPDSDAEESARLDNVEAQTTDTGQKFYLGLSVSFLDHKAAIPVLSPDRERLLEYDITRAISQVTQAHKPVVGVMSALPVLGRALKLHEQPLQPWVLASELKHNFTVRDVPMDVEKIPDDIKVLLVIEPRGILPTAEYAIDQFIMRGGKVIAFVDPYCYFDQQPNLQNPFGGSTAGHSTLYDLFRAWGVNMNMQKVIADLTYASGSGPQLMPTLLSLDDGALNPNNVVTSKVGTLLMPFAGYFSGKPAAGLKETVLVHTSKNAMPVDLIIATLTGEPATRDFKPTGKEEPLAIELTGKFKTAFPHGKPQAFDETGQPKKASGKEAKVPQLMETKGDNSVVLVSDADMLTDNASVEVQDVFGQRLVIPRNGNLAFAEGLVEQFAGDSALIKLRARAAFTRPLTVIQNMEARAQQAYLGKIDALEQSLQKTKDKLESLQKARPGAQQSSVLTPEQEKEIENFRRKAVETRQQLRELRKNLRKETDALEFWTKVINIGLVPLLVTLLGLGVAIVKRRRTAR